MNRAEGPLTACASGIRRDLVSPATATLCRAKRQSGSRSASVLITVGDWQAGVEPVVVVTPAGRGGHAEQRASYAIDGGYAGLVMFAVVEAGLAGGIRATAGMSR